MFDYAADKVGMCIVFQQTASLWVIKTFSHIFSRGKKTKKLKKKQQHCNAKNVARNIEQQTPSTCNYLLTPQLPSSQLSYFVFNSCLFYEKKTKCSIINIFVCFGGVATLLKSMKFTRIVVKNFSARGKYFNG